MHYLKYLNKYYNNSNTFDNNRFSYNTIYFLKKLKINIFNDIVDIYDYEKYFNNITKNDLSSKQNLVTSSFYHLIHRYKMFYFLKKNIFFKKFENIFKSEKIYGLKINNIKKRNIYKDHLYNIETRRKRLLIEKKKKKLEEKNKVIVIDIEFVCKH